MGAIVSQRIWIPLVLLAAGLTGIGLGRWFVAAEAPPPAPVIPAVVLESGTWLSPPRALPAFNLLDQDGKPADAGRFQGRWTFVFFGFTHCPEACPTTLAHLAMVRRALAADLPANQVPDVLLVTVDPERDTPAVLKSYLAAFDPAFTGLTGQSDAVRAFATALGVPYQKIEMDGDYMMDHSTAIMLVNPSGQLAALLTAPHDAAVIAANYQRVLLAGQSRP